MGAEIFADGVLDVIDVWGMTNVTTQVLTVIDGHENSHPDPVPVTVINPETMFCLLRVVAMDETTHVIYST